MASPPQKKVLVPIADGTEPMEAVITIDVLRRSGADVTVASAGYRLPVDACWGVKLVADALVSDLPASSAFDLIALPGGMPGSAALRDCAQLEAIVKKHVENGGLCAAICAAPAIMLGHWGLLKGLKATCYPAFMDKLPADVVKVESRVQVDGKIVTSRGAGTGMEFSLALVEQLYGKDKADEVAGAMEVWYSSPTDHKRKFDDDVATFFSSPENHGYAAALLFPLLGASLRSRQSRRSPPSSSTMSRPSAPRSGTAPL